MVFDVRPRLPLQARLLFETQLVLEQAYIRELACVGDPASIRGNTVGNILSRSDVINSLVTSRQYQSTYQSINQSIILFQIKKAHDN